MRNHHLEVAKEFIQKRDFISARKVLNKIPNHPTAKKWLAKMDELERKWVDRPQALETIKLPIQLEVLLRKHLNKGEVVLWHEQPEPTIYGYYFTSDRLKKRYIGMASVLFPLFMFNSLNNSSFLSWTSMLLPLSFIIGPMLRPWVGQRRARNIHYVLTNRQAFIIEKSNVKPIYIPPSRIEIVTEHSGFTSIIFHRYTLREDRDGIKLPIGFLGIAKAERVNQIIAKYYL